MTLRLLAALTLAGALPLAAQSRSSPPKPAQVDSVPLKVYRGGAEELKFPA